jgi:predicted dithiol-disulfide oxidoreductase (DUF899 family)
MTETPGAEMTDITVVSPQEWLGARKELLVQEAEVGRAREALSAARQKLPVTEITKDYVFEGPDGKASLEDLFEGRRQLIVYHFMFDPAWDEGCPHCSLLADNIGHLSHLHARHTTLVLVSRAPWAKIQPFRARMGWAVPWYSSFGSDFNYDFHVTQDESRGPVMYDYKDKATLIAEGNAWCTKGEGAGLSAFLRQDGKIYHSYSSYDGEDVLYGTFGWLDMTPLGRREEGRAWLRHHDKYGA